MMYHKAMKLPAGQLYGHVLRGHEVAGLALIETSYPASLELPLHSHEQAYLCFVLQGAYTEIYGSRTRLCKPSALIFHPPDELHSDHFHNARGRCFNVEIDSQYLERIREHSVILDSPIDFYGGLLAHLSMKLYKEFCEAEEASPLVIEGLALEILGEASRHTARVSERRVPRWLKQARELIHANFSTTLTLAFIAESVAVHPVHLARAFRRHYRYTIGEYVRQLRIEFACRELSLSDIPLVEIASAAGFSSQSHFSTIFKRHTGLTPAEYRAVARSR